MKFHWHAKKAAANLSKHGVSFEEAVTVFDDPLFEIFADPDHSALEKRFIIIGESSQHRLLVVSYTEWPEGIRLISARDATPREREAYEAEI